MRAETKVGIFFTVGLVTLFLATLWVEDFRLFKQTYTLKTSFNSVAGLPERSMVRLGGLKVGRVRKMALENNRISLELEMDKEAEVRADSLATISADTIVGARYVNISLGSPEANVLHDGDILPSKDSPGMEQLMEHLDGLVVSAQDFVDGINKTQGEIVAKFNKLIDENSPKITEIMDSFKEAGAKANNIMETVQGITTAIDVGEGTIGKLVRDDTLYERANILTENLTTLTHDMANGEGFIGQLVRDKELYGKFNDIVSSLSEVSDEIRNGTGTLAMLVSSDETYKQLKAIGANFALFSDQLNSFMTDNQTDMGEAIRSIAKMAPEFQKSMGDLNAILAKVNSGEGTLGKLVNDPALYDEANQTVKEVRKAVEGLQDQAPLTTFTGMAAGALR